tara:strand:+ start:72571 stop:75036 length:2466 start_codon:yes stop_codon:yes gene_type:complete
MATQTNDSGRTPFFPKGVSIFLKNRAIELAGVLLALFAGLISIALASHNSLDPSFNTSTSGEVDNLIGIPGSYTSDLLFQAIGIAVISVILILLSWSWALISHRGLSLVWLRLAVSPLTLLFLAIGLSTLSSDTFWPTSSGLGGISGSLISDQLISIFGNDAGSQAAISSITIILSLLCLFFSVGLKRNEWLSLLRGFWMIIYFITVTNVRSIIWLIKGGKASKYKNKPTDTPKTSMDKKNLVINKTNFFRKLTFWNIQTSNSKEFHRDEPDLYKNDSQNIQNSKSAATNKRHRIVSEKIGSPKPSKRGQREGQRSLNLANSVKYELPPLSLLTEPKPLRSAKKITEESLEQNAKLLLSVLEDFGIYGEILKVHPGPVVTLYEFVPQAGTRTSRVIGLADDIARSMSAISVRVATIPGKNVIGIELPNSEREGVLLRELLGSETYENTAAKLTLALGKTISGEPIIADLARMPHLLVAGTTGSGKSVAVNSMILSLLYRLPPEECRLILIDPKMLELSVYDDIPHLLTPVVTDPSKAVVALKWVVREMENRYQSMSKLGVRNITGYNKRLEEAREKGEKLTRRVQIGLDTNTGEPLFEEQELDISPMPYIVIVVDEMADLMLVAGKDIEGAVQRLAQMARAAGIHLIMATQRPSVDVITGTIKANFPTRISFQVTSKIDSRTILGEAGAEQLLGQGDMLFLEGGGRLTRVHGPLVTDSEVEKVIKVLRSQGSPAYQDEVIAEVDTATSTLGETAVDDPLYDQAVALVSREGKASTSFIQRHLQIGYNRAARIVERMESQGVISKANHAGKREVLISDHSSS